MRRLPRACGAASGWTTTWRSAGSLRTVIRQGKLWRRQHEMRIGPSNDDRDVAQCRRPGPVRDLLGPTRTYGLTRGTRTLNHPSDRGAGFHVENLNSIAVRSLLK